MKRRRLAAAAANIHGPPTHQQTNKPTDIRPRTCAPFIRCIAFTTRIFETTPMQRVAADEASLREKPVVYAVRAGTGMATRRTGCTRERHRTGLPRQRPRQIGQCVRQRVRVGQGFEGWVDKEAGRRRDAPDDLLPIGKAGKRCALGARVSAGHPGAAAGIVPGAEEPQSPLRCRGQGWAVVVVADDAEGRGGVTGEHNSETRPSAVSGLAVQKEMTGAALGQR